MNVLFEKWVLEIPHSDKYMILLSYESETVGACYMTKMIELSWPIIYVGQYAGRSIAKNYSADSAPSTLGQTHPKFKPCMLFQQNTGAFSLLQIFLVLFPLITLVIQT